MRNQSEKGIARGEVCAKMQRSGDCSRTDLLVRFLPERVRGGMIILACWRGLNMQQFKLCVPCIYAVDCTTINDAYASIERISFGKVQVIFIVNQFCGGWSRRSVRVKE